MQDNDVQATTSGAGQPVPSLDTLDRFIPEETCPVCDSVVLPDETECYLCGAELHDSGLPGPKLGDKCKVGGCAGQLEVQPNDSSEDGYCLACDTCGGIANEDDYMQEE